MSTKYKNRKNQKRSFNSLILVVGGGILLIAVALFMAFGGNSNDPNDGTPALAVDRDKVEYGDVKFNTNLTFDIKVTNTGDGTLRFKEVPYVEVREGC